MHRISEEIFAQNEKLQRDQCFSYTDDLGLDHQVSVINFDMTFVDFFELGKAIHIDKCIMNSIMISTQINIWKFK